MDKATAKEMGPKIEAALADVAAEYGLTVTCAGGKYTDGSFEPKITFTNDTFAQDEWNRWADLEDLPRDMVGKTFVSHGVTYTITGFKPKNRAMPILADDEQGRHLKFRCDAPMKALLKRTAEAVS